MKKDTRQTKPQGGSARGKFSGRLGYVLSVAGSAVGLGNIWRFPYLAAKYGGGIFLLVYLLLTVTFGYVLIVSETALGRMTGKSPVGAFQSFGGGRAFRFGGWVNALVPGYSVTRPGALEGVKYFLVPDFKSFSWMTVVAAMGQMFYSLSIAMGVLYTYGSYIGKDVDIERSTTQVALFDTGVAMLGGMMIIPAVFAFSGGDMSALQAGPSLTFITLPKIFDSMGMGTVVGVAFFLMFFFAALTSSISLMETSVSTLEDELGWSRPRCCLLMAAVMLVFGSLACLGYGALDFVRIFGMAFLDFFDFLTNSVMMPVAAFCTCALILSRVGVDRLAQEVELSSAFRRKGMYRFFLKYLAPACIAIILVSSIANVLGWISL